MFRRHAGDLLYDYFQEALPTEEYKFVKEHLAVCRGCADNAAIVKNIIKNLTEATVQPSEKLPTEYWQHFADNVERRLEHDAYTGSKFRPSFLHTIFRFIEFNLRPVAAAVALMMVGIAVLLFRSKPDDTIVQQPPRDIFPATKPIELASDRMHDYFHKSKILLVGLSNMKIDEPQEIDLAAEQKVSRDLIYEARFLKQQPLDTRSAKLIDDMNKILIEFAAMKGNGNRPHVELVRRGIYEENLLYKVRLAEKMYEASEENSNQQ